MRLNPVNQHGSIIWEKNMLFYPFCIQAVLLLLLLSKYVKGMNATFISKGSIHIKHSNLKELLLKSRVKWFFMQKSLRFIWCCDVAVLNSMY